MSSPLLRGFPSVNELLENPQLKRLMDRVSHSAVVSGARTVLDNLRADVQKTAAEIKIPPINELAEQVAKWILNDEATNARSIINATGQLLDPRFGPPPLAEGAVAAMADAARSYTFADTNSSISPPRPTAAAEKLLAQITGADAAVAVNSQAGAAILAIASLAEGKSLLVSRGQICASGDGVRLQDLVRAAGAQLCEVGMTNQTTIADYEAAIGANTGAILRMRAADFSLPGKVVQPTLAELVALGRRHRLPVIDLLPCATLIDLERFGVRGETVVSDSVRDGADVVVFGGDQWVGGPQCGLAVGRSDALRLLAAHPRQLALRLDKLRHAALAATLGFYQDSVGPEQSVPILSLLSTTVENLRNRAERLAPQIAALPAISAAEAREGTSTLTTASLSSRELPTWGVAVAAREIAVEEFATQLRQVTPSLIASVEGDRIYFDLRSVLPSQDAQIVGVLASLKRASESPSG